MPAAQLLDFRLVVVYNGVKATQYFTKFAQESLDVFRSDLLALKLPHPKRENITFVSHGHIECFWYGAPKDGILHKNIRDKTQPNTHEGILQLRQRLKDLSIGHILFKIIDPKAESNGSTKRANPYAQKPSNRQEGSRPSKVARTEIAQPPPTVRTPQGIQTVQTLQGIQTVQTPQVVRLAARAVPFPFKKGDLTNEPQGRAQLATNLQRKPSDATTTPTPNALPTPPDSSGVRQVLVSHRPGPRSIPAPRVSLGKLTKIPTNENHQKSNLALGEHSGSQGLHTNDGTKQLTAIPKVPVPERKDPAPIVSVPNPQVPISTQKRVTSTHTLPPKPVAGTVTSRFSATAIPATQAPATTGSPSSKQNVSSSLPPRPSSGLVPLPANLAPLASSAAQGMQESEELAVKKEAVRTPSLPGLSEQQRQSRDQMRQNQEEGVSQSQAQPQPQPQPQQPQEGQELGFLRRRRNSRWERDSRPTTSAMVLPTPSTTSGSNGGLTIKTEPGLEPQMAFTPPSEWISPQRISFDPYNPFEDHDQDQGQGQNAVPRESMTNGRSTEANAIPVALQRNGQVHPPTRPRGAKPSSTPRASGPSAPASNATDAIAIQRLTREAWGVKRQISANMERERVIIDELEILGSRWVPEGTMVDSGPNKKRKREDDRVEGGDGVRDGDELHYPRHRKYYEDQKAYNRALVSSLEMRLSKAESSLSQTQSKLSETEAHLLQARAEFTDSKAAVVHYHSKLSQAQASLTQLQTTLADERRLRKEAEDAIADVRRECIKPFVVPSLLDAFVEVSKLTTRAMVSAQRGTAEYEREKRRGEKGKSVDRGPPPLQPQQKAPSLPQSTTTMETKAGDLQPRHGNAGSQSGTSTTTATPMNVGEAQSHPGRVDGSLKPPAWPSALAINDVSVGAGATTLPLGQTLPPEPMAAREDVDIRSATPSGHQPASLLPTATTVEGSSARPSDVNNIAPEISGDVDMDAAPILTGDRSPRQVPLTQRPPTETTAPSSVLSTKEHVVPSQVPLLSSSESMHVQPELPVALGSSS